MAIKPPNDRRREELDLEALARETSYDRYLRAVFAPRPQRHTLAIVAAYFAEISRVPFAVTEPVAGEVRLQWWRDALGGAESDAATGSPLADAMRSLVLATPSLRDPCMALIEARHQELYPEPLSGDEALRDYFELLGRFEVMAPAALLDAADQAGAPPLTAAGTAIAICDTAQRLGLHVLHERPLLPLSYFDGRTPHQCSEAEKKAQLRAAISRLSEMAARELATAHASSTRISRPHLLAVLPAALVEPYFRALQQPGFDPAATDVMLAPLTRITRVAWAVWRRRL